MIKWRKSKAKTISSHDDFLQEAKRTQDVVNACIDNKDFSQLSKNLDEIASSNGKKIKYVFERTSLSTNIKVIVVCLVFVLVFIYCVVVGLGTLIYSNDFELIAWLDVAFSILILSLNSFCIYRNVLEFKFKKRYESYYNVLRYVNTTLVDDLASYSNQEKSLVIGDLELAIKKKLIPQGHFGTDNLIFMVSDATYELYKEKQAVYDRYYKKQSEERMRMQERDDYIQEILEKGKTYVNEIHKSNDIIKDKIISAQLDQMENVVKMIFHEVDINPKQANKLGMFLNYYLPTTKKLLDAYIEIDEKEVRGDTLEKTKQEIEGAIGKIVVSFENLLDKFYQEQKDDLSSEISALEIMMKQENLYK